MTNAMELVQKLKSAAQEEIMCREASDTSDAWQDLASPENILALIEIALPVLEQKGADINCSEWIRCSEHLPKEDGQYWGWWSEEKRQGPVWFIERQSQFQSYQITHWMPLPAPPEQQASTTPQIDNDGWIEWCGGKQPIANDRELAIKFRDGTVMNETHSDCWVWSHGGDDDDIIAYRVIERDGR